MPGYQPLGKFPPFHQSEGKISFSQIRGGIINAEEVILAGGTRGRIRSENYDPTNETGWGIFGDGSASFYGDVFFGENAIFQGDLYSANWDGTIPVDLSSYDVGATAGFALDSSEGTIQISGDAFLGGELIMIGTDSVFRTAPAGQPHIRLSGGELGTSQMSAVQMRFSLSGLLQADSTLGGVASYVENQGTNSERRTVFISSGGWLGRTPTGRAHISLKGETLDEAGEPLVAIGSGGEPVKLLTEGGIQTRDGSQTEPGIFFVSDDDTGFFLPSAGALGIAVGGGAVALFADDDGHNLQGLGYNNYTPTLTNLNVGSTGAINTARYVRIGDVVHVEIFITLGGTGISVGDVRIQLPFNPAFGTNSPAAGECLFIDSGSGIHKGALNFAGNVLQVRRLNVSGSNVTIANLSSTTPFTWGEGDSIRISAVYKAA